MKRIEERGSIIDDVKEEIEEEKMEVEMKGIEGFERVIDINVNKRYGWKIEMKMKKGVIKKGEKGENWLKER